MRTFFDSSAFAKRYIEETGSQAVEALCQEADELALSVICVPEIISAFTRRLREQALTLENYRLAKRRLAEEVQDAIIVQLIPEVITAAIAILEANPIRAMDALHVACAAEWKAERFVSADQRQIAAAKRFGLSTRHV